MSGGVLGVLHNTSIGARVFIGPFLGFALTVAALVLADRQAETAATSIDTVHEAASRRVGKIDELLAGSAKIHSDVSRHLALVDSGVEEAKLATIRDQVDSDLGRLADVLANLETAADPAEPQALADIADKLERYAKSARNMNRMATMDRLIAIPLMADVDTQFTALLGRIQTTQADIQAAAARAAHEARLAAAAARTRMWLVIAGLLAVMMIGTLSIARSISSPLKRLTATMRDLSHGRLDVAVQGMSLRNEIGEMAQALHVFQENARAVEQLKADQERQRAEAETAKHRTIHELADQLEARVSEVVVHVTSGASQVRANAETMLTHAKAANDQAATVAAASQQMGANVTAAASSAEELYTSILSLTERARQSFDTVREAVTAVENTNSHVGGLSEAAGRIGEIVKLISDIASQTNLLALNATIEAARAGDAGKGFAVVASEVKNLASQTAKATEDIAAQIRGMQQATEAAVGAIQAVGGAVMAIDRTVGSIAEAMEEQSQATLEIARNVSEAATGTSEVSHNIQDVSEVAHETGAAATEVLQAAELLDGQATTLNNEMKSFIGRLRHG
ncbi:MAG TPA: methyl-accepting chemotaxis protein [Azospirillaceae bacterium]|nr:methyl-accepting chemotaxis protein [Azospirillaceae bacterium]